MPAKYKYKFHCGPSDIWEEVESDLPPESFAPVCTVQTDTVTPNSVSLTNVEQPSKYRVGIPSYFSNGTPYYRSGTAAGTYLIGYFTFPGSEAVGVPTKFVVSGNMEASSASAYYIQIYDVDHSQVIAQVQMNTNTAIGDYSTDVITNIPAASSVFALRIVMGSTARLRVSSAMLEWL
jgi:hypothetical protein